MGLVWVFVREEEGSGLDVQSLGSAFKLEERIQGDGKAYLSGKGETEDAQESQSEGDEIHLERN